MVASDPEGIGSERLDYLKKSGYDYVEMPLAQIMALSHIEFDELVEYVLSVGLPCEACNNFVPASHPITGNNVDFVKLEEYIDEALNRAERLQVKSIVFGSSGAKNVPEGFSTPKAWQQIVETLRMISDKIGNRDLTVAIEPLCKLESNIVITAEEGLQLAKEVNRHNIRLLIDYYHLAMENEDQKIILKAGNYLQHIHLANPTGRIFPKENDHVDYRAFIQDLKDTGYNSRVSIEAFSDNFKADALAALVVMHQVS
jgi:D-psicose/D-tagatose/L-ribulose 3-epimerase